MVRARSDIARHVEAAKRLLAELDQQAVVVMTAIGREDGAEFVQAVSRRDTLVADLQRAVDEIAHQRAWTASPTGSNSAPKALTELTQALHGAVARQQEILSAAAAERDRISTAMKQADRPDALASRYTGLSSSAPPNPTISVAG
jgi:hypothetical protein